MTTRAMTMTSKRTALWLAALSTASWLLWPAGSVSAQEEAPDAASTANPRSPERCESDLRIRAIHENGEVVRLEDGTTWSVEPEEAEVSAAWGPDTMVTLCLGKLYEPASGGVVSVRPTGHTPNPTPSPLGAAGNRVSVITDGTRFEINGVSFSAKTICDLRQGDRVDFASGSPHGACTSATLENTRNGARCEVWCDRIKSSAPDPTRADLPDGDPTRVESTPSTPDESRSGRDRVKQRIERGRYQDYHDGP